MLFWASLLRLAAGPLNGPVNGPGGYRDARLEVGELLVLCIGVMADVGIFVVEELILGGNRALGHLQLAFWCGSDEFFDG